MLSTSDESEGDFRVNGNETPLDVTIISRCSSRVTSLSTKGMKSRGTW